MVANDPVNAWDYLGLREVVIWEWVEFKRVKEKVESFPGGIFTGITWVEYVEVTWTGAFYWYYTDDPTHCHSQSVEEIITTDINRGFQTGVPQPPTGPSRKFSKLVEAVFGALLDYGGSDGGGMSLLSDPDYISALNTPPKRPSDDELKSLIQ